MLDADETALIYTTQQSFYEIIRQITLRNVTQVISLITAGPAYNCLRHSISVSFVC
jgi:hypothetical protein